MPSNFGKCDDVRNGPREVLMSTLHHVCKVRDRKWYWSYFFFQESTCETICGVNCSDVCVEAATVRDRLVSVVGPILEQLKGYLSNGVTDDAGESPDFDLYVLALKRQLECIRSTLIIFDIAVFNDIVLDFNWGLPSSRSWAFATALSAITTHMEPGLISLVEALDTRNPDVALKRGLSKMERGLCILSTAVGMLPAPGGGHAKRDSRKELRAELQILYSWLASVEAKFRLP